MGKGKKPASMRQRAQDHVRHCTSTGKDIEEIPLDIAKDRKKKNNFCKELDKLNPKKRRSRPRIEVFNTETKGVGVRSTMAIKEGVEITEFTSALGKRLNPREASNHMSSISTEHKSGPRSYVLGGSIAFLNHACKVHANCETCESRDVDPRGENDWKFVRTCQDVDKGEELTVCYHDLTNLPCDKCKK